MILKPDVPCYQKKDNSDISGKKHILGRLPAKHSTILVVPDCKLPNFNINHIKKASNYVFIVYLTYTALS